MANIIDLDALLVQMQEDSIRWFGEETPKNLTLHVLGLVGESGEVADILKKITRGSVDFNTPGIMEHLRTELIDVFIYLVMLFGATRTNVLEEYEKKRAYNEQRFGKESGLATIHQLEQS